MLLEVNNVSKYDVVVVGVSFAGATTINLLACQGKQILKHKNPI